MSTVDTEQVMVVPTQLFRDCGYFQGFMRETDKYLSTLLDPLHTQYLPRGDMEQDPGYKQLIPYCVFQHTPADGSPQLFQYTRGSGQGESRLHQKRSIGIGGHISTLDASDSSPYDEGMRRELEEEVHIRTNYTDSCVGLINDDETEVGKVHLGVVHIFDVEEPRVESAEAVICEAEFRPVEELLGRLEQFESWSQIVLTALFGSQSKS